MEDAADSTVDTVDAACDEINSTGLESKDASRDAYTFDPDPAPSIVDLLLMVLLVHAVALLMDHKERAAVIAAFVYLAILMYLFGFFLFSFDFL